MTNILCVDNSTTIRKIVQDCVLDLGFDFFEAENGKVGIEKAKEITDIRMVILDWNMPVMSGRETLVNLRNLEGFEQVIILVLIKIENKDQVMEAVNLGATNYMLKPFSVNNLQDKIEELIKDAV
jgi:two-component system chemotaxis response regulator CheY